MSVDVTSAVEPTEDSLLNTSDSFHEHWEEEWRIRAAEIREQTQQECFQTATNVVATVTAELELVTAERDDLRSEVERLERELAKLRMSTEFLDVENLRQEIEDASFIEVERQLDEQEADFDAKLARLTRQHESELEVLRTSLAAHALADRTLIETRSAALVDEAQQQAAIAITRAQQERNTLEATLVSRIHTVVQHVVTLAGVLGEQTLPEAATAQVGAIVLECQQLLELSDHGLFTPPSPASPVSAKQQQQQQRQMSSSPSSGIVQSPLRSLPDAPADRDLSVQVVATKIDERVRALQLRARVEFMVRGGFLMHLYPNKDPTCKFFQLSPDQKQLLCTTTPYGTVPTKPRCNRPFKLDDHCTVVHGRLACAGMQSDEPFSADQVEHVFSIQSAASGKRRTVMALNAEDFVNWADGLRLLLGLPIQCMQTVSERRRLKSQFYAEFGWSEFATS